MKGKNYLDISQSNKSLILKLIGQPGDVTRSMLSKETNLTEAAVSKIVSNLIDQNLIREIKYIKGVSGRRAIGLELNKESYKLLGVHISRLEYSIGIFNLTGEMETTNTFYFSSTNLEKMLSEVLESVHKYNDEYQTVAGCFAVPGPFNMEKGTISVITEIDNYVDFDIQSFFKNNLDMPLIFIHDANSGAQGHYRLSNPENMEDILYYHVGQGVGLGVIDEGELVIGRHGMAGEIGHVSIDIHGPKCKCGNYGCLELYSSSIAFLRRARNVREQSDTKLNEIETLTVENIVEAARKGDKCAIDLLIEESKYIAYGLVTLLNVYNPEMVIIGDELALAEEFLLDTVEEVIKERNVKDIREEVKIKTISNKETNYILVGAGVTVAEYCLDNLEIFENMEENKNEKVK